MFANCACCFGKFFRSSENFALRFAVMQKNICCGPQQQEVISSNAVCGRGFARLPAQVQAKLLPFRLPVSLAKRCETAHKQLMQVSVYPDKV